jgi:hypothetical protein
MAANPPHLLTLPREIRNDIYSYLHKEVVVHNAGTSYPSILDVQVRLENVPYMSVLLINSQIYQEYREADCFRNLSAQVDMDLKLRYWLRGPVMVRELKLSALSFVRHVTIVHKRCIGLGMMRHVALPDESGIGLGMIEKYLGEKMPMLRTVRHLTDAGETSILEDPKLFSEWPLTRFDTDEHSLPRTFLGLPLVQMAIAKHVQCFDAKSYPEGLLLHTVKTMRLVLYTTEDPYRKHTWTPEQGNRYWNLRCPYPQDFLYSLEPEKQAQLARLSTALVSWKEGCFVTETHSPTASGGQDSAMGLSDNVKVTLRDTATENEE